MNMFAGLTGELHRRREEDRIVAEWRALPIEKQSLCPWCGVNNIMFGCYCVDFTAKPGKYDITVSNVTVSNVKAR